MSFFLSKSLQDLGDKVIVQGLIALSGNRFFKSKDMLKRNASVWLKLMRRQAVAGREGGRTGSLLRTESRTAGAPLSPTLRTPHHQPTP